MDPGFSATHGTTSGAQELTAQIAFLDGVAFLDSLPHETREKLALAAESRHFSAGEYIVAQHDKATHASFLKSGLAQVLLKFDDTDELMIETLAEPGAMLGWSVFRPPYRYTASIRCETECEVVLIPRMAFEDVFEKDPQLEFQLLQHTAEVVANRLARTQKLLVDRSAIAPDLETAVEHMP
jgi:CRP-like cAMP-binding protein